MILVSGATGQLGQHVMAQLRQRLPIGQFAGLARAPDKARTLAAQGYQIRHGDYDQPQTLPEAFRGVSTLLFISSMSLERTAQQRQVVDAALRAGVEHIVYTGLAIKDIGTSATAAIMESHFQTEQHILDSGVAYTFLRNTMYAEAIPAIVGPNLLPQVIALNAGNGKVPFALRHELGEAAANVLVEPGHRNRTYHLTGATPLGFAELADRLSELTGRPVVYRDMEPATLRSVLTTAGLPDFMVELTVGTLEDIKHGQYAIASNDLATLLGRAPAPAQEMLQQVFARLIAH